MEEVEREASEAGILVMTVHHNFYLTLLLLHFSKMFLYGTNPPSTFCFSISALIMEEVMA